jgi:hypothetical protein
MATWLDREGITTSVEVRLGDPVAAVLATAQDTGADVLALPTPWRIGGRIIAVDISRRLLYRAPIPVLIGRLECWWPTICRHLLVPIGFGATASVTLRTALALARWHQAHGNRPAYPPAFERYTSGRYGPHLCRDRDASGGRAARRGTGMPHSYAEEHECRMDSPQG